jgi:hypothetical protein
MRSPRLKMIKPLAVKRGRGGGGAKGKVGRWKARNKLNFSAYYRNRATIDRRSAPLCYLS